MDRIPPEILVSIVSLLPSKDIVASLTVNTRWFDALDTDIAVWRNVYSQDRHPFLPLLLLFDKKSHSSLRSIHLDYSFVGMSSASLDVVRRVMLRSSHSLLRVSLDVSPILSFDEIQEDLLTKCPKLKVLKITDSTSSGSLPGSRKPRVKVLEDSITESASHSSSQLRTLWVPTLTARHFFSIVLTFRAFRGPVIFPFLSKLSLGSTDVDVLRAFLATVSSTLKFLRWYSPTFRTTADEGKNRYPISLPNVEVLQLFGRRYPKWLEAPSAHILICSVAFDRSETLSHLCPSLRKIWLSGLYGRCTGKIMDGLGKAFAGIEEIRMQEDSHFDSNQVLQMISARRKLESLKDIKKLILPFRHLEGDLSNRLKGMGVELEDVSKSCEWIEI